MEWPSVNDIRIAIGAILCTALIVATYGWLSGMWIMRKERKR